MLPDTWIGKRVAVHAIGGTHPSVVNAGGSDLGDWAEQHDMWSLAPGDLPYADADEVRRRCVTPVVSAVLTA